VNKVAKGLEVNTVTGGAESKDRLPTIGPASSSEAVLGDLMRLGMTLPVSFFSRHA